MKRIGEIGVVLVLLAVPAGLYLYWQNMSNARKKPARVPMAARASAFQGGAEGGNSNPLRGGPGEAQAAPAAAPMAQGGAASPGRPAAMAAPAASSMAPTAGNAGARGGAAAPMTPPMPAAPAAGAAAMAAPAPVVAPVASSAAVAGLFNPKSGRDPMQSVADRRQIAAYDSAQRYKASMRNHPIKTAKPLKPTINPATLVTLEGIMTINNSLSAIVNGDMVSVGSVLKKGIKVVAITPTSVTFSYRGEKGKMQQFKKVLKK